MFKRKYLAIMVALCMVLSLVLLAGCGSDSGKPESSTGEKKSVSEKASTEVTTEATTEAADPAEKFVGAWKIAGAESKGVTMGGNFGEMLGMSDTSALNINEDGTGDMTFGKETVKLKWEKISDDVISVIPEDKTDVTGDKVDVTYKDDALFMTIEQEDEKASLIYTHDGKYDGIKEIDMSKAEPITSEKDLLGEWTMTGMKIYGVTISGDAKTLSEMGGGTDSAMIFKEDGVVTTSTGDNSYEVTKDGAVLKTEGLTGDKISCPVKKLDDGIVVDMSEYLGGTEFIMLLTKK